MKKKQRIKALEAEVATLRTQLAYLEFRVAQRDLPVVPTYPGVPAVPHEPFWSIQNPHDFCTDNTFDTTVYIEGNIC